MCLHKLNIEKKKMKPKKVGDLVSTADEREKILTRDTTNWNYEFYTITEFIKDAKLSYHINSYREGYSQALLQQTEMSIEEKEKVLKRLHL